MKRILNGPERLWFLFDNRAARLRKRKKLARNAINFFLAPQRPVTEKKVYRDEWIEKKALHYDFVDEIFMQIAAESEQDENFKVFF